MDQLLRLFDLFNAAAKTLAGYLPQNGPELLKALQNLFDWGLGIDSWIGVHYGVSIKVFVVAISNILITAGTFLLTLLQEIVKRMQ